MTFAEYATDTAAKTIWAEARGEGTAGMRAVAHVLLNRVKDGRWGSNLLTVCWWGAQFSCWNALLTIDGKTRNNPDRMAIANVRDDDPNLQIAKGLIAGALNEPDPTDGATHYYADTMAAPPWVAKAAFTVQIGRHRFYRNVT